MRRQSREKEQADVYLRIDPESAERILISTKESLERRPENGVRYRRRTTSLKGRKPVERRRASVPALYRLNIKPKTSRKNLLQKMGSRLAKAGDELLKRAGTNSNLKVSDICDHGCETELKTLKHYAKHLAEVGDYLNTLYSSERSLLYPESGNTTLVENCLVLTSILVSLKNNNVVVVNTSDLSTLSSLCRVHRAKSLSRAKR